jgi:hypothetical protein
VVDFPARCFKSYPSSDLIPLPIGGGRCNLCRKGGEEQEPSVVGHFVSFIHGLWILDSIKIMDKWTQRTDGISIYYLK